MMRVGRAGVVTMEESKTAEDSLHVVEGMQFDRGYISPYFVTDPERMVAEYENCKLLLVDKKISTARDMIGILEGAIRGGHPLLIMAEDIEQASKHDLDVLCPWPASLALCAALMHLCARAACRKRWPPLL